VAEPSAAFIGDLALDCFFRADRWPQLGDKAPLTWIEDRPGGMIANAAAVFAALGASCSAKTVFLAALRPSSTTSRLAADLRDYGIDVRIQEQPDWPESTTFVIQVGADSTTMWPTLGLERFELSDPDFAALQQARHIYSTPCELRPLRHAGAGPAGLLRGLGQTGAQLWLDLDVGDLEAGDRALVDLAQVVIVNQFGLDRLGGWLLDDPRREVICTGGSQGVTLYRSGLEPTTVAAFPVSAVDAIGAGDTFGGACLLAVSRGATTEDAIRVASGAAALAVSREGGRAGAVSADRLADFCSAYDPPTAGLVKELFQ
jgi:sugar/nucleoside kinase (ribokinase family)